MRKISSLTTHGIHQKMVVVVFRAESNLLGEDKLIENELAKTIGKIAKAVV